jgi:hypothetical protein
MPEVFTGTIDFNGAGFVDTSRDGTYYANLIGYINDHPYDMPASLVVAYEQSGGLFDLAIDDFGGNGENDVYAKAWAILKSAGVEDPSVYLGNNQTERVANPIFQNNAIDIVQQAASRFSQENDPLHLIPDNYADWVAAFVHDITNDDFALSGAYFQEALTSGNLAYVAMGLGIGAFGVAMAAVHMVQGAFEFASAALASTWSFVTDTFSSFASGISGAWNSFSSGIVSIFDYNHNGEWCD